MAALQEKLLAEERRGKDSVIVATAKSSGQAAIEEVDSFFSELQIDTPPPAPEVDGEQKQELEKKEKLSEPKAKKPVCLLSDTEDLELLHVLAIQRVRFGSGPSRQVRFQRVDELFSLESKVAQPSWKVRWILHRSRRTLQQQQQKRKKKTSRPQGEGEPPASASPTTTLQSGKENKNAVQNFFTSASTITKSIP